MTYVLRVARAALIVALPLYAAGVLLLWLGHAEAAPAPTVTSVSPALGPSVGGTAITVSGSGFVAGASVTIGGTPATSIVVASASQITAVTPAGTPGAAVVTVTNLDTQSSTLSGGFTYQYPAPTTGIVAPNTGSSAGGTAITITGTGFLAGATVTIGGTAATAVNVANATTITATTPARPIGAADVRVTNTDGQFGTLAAAFTYTAAAAPTVSSVAPASGTVNGGTSITVTGTGFVAGATLTIGGAAATSVLVTAPTTITAVTPARATPGAVAVTATNPDGQSGTRAAGYTYNPLPAPTTGSVAPTSGVAAGGTPVTITGTNFVAGATVSFGGTAATDVVVVSATSITAKTPAKTAGVSAITVTNPDAQASTLPNAFTYTANPAPTVGTVAPTTGPIAGGTAITITGTGFLAGATVKLGDVAATDVVVVSATSITAKTPAGASGQVAATVTNSDLLTGTLASAFTYAAPGTPTVTTVAPAAGPLAGGTAITITGTNFASGATVTIGSVAATGVVVVSATSITAVTPARESGGQLAVAVKVGTVEGSLATGFTYQGPAPTARSLTPDEGSLAGGTVVVVRGTGFLKGVSVSFGGVAATKVTLKSDTEIEATTPAGKAAAAVDVVVTNPGSPPSTLERAYSYAPPGSPTVAKSPPAGGIVLVVAGTKDLQAFIKAQKFTVGAVFTLDVAKQEWKRYIPGAPAVVNTLTAVAATDVVIVRRQPE